MSEQALWNSLLMTKRSLDILKEATKEQRGADAYSVTRVEQLHAHSRAIRELSEQVRALSVTTRAMARQRTGRTSAASELIIS